MTRTCSNSRFHSIPSLLLALCLCATTAQAAEVPLRAFSASYDLTADGLSLGTAELSLEPYGKLWRWRLTTRARGIYSLFIRDKPYSETTFTQDMDGVRLQQIVIADENDKDDIETASFDWEHGQLQVLRKGRRHKLALGKGVYDLQSIHVLAADMQLTQRDNSTVQFYRKGKLVKSRLAYLGEGSIDVDGEETVARIYEHTVSGSKEKLKYYYDERNPLLPVLIESSKSGDSPSTLKLRKVDWRS
jgi:hypothetical protein